MYSRLPARSTFDSLKPSGSTFHISGWVVDPLAAAGHAPVTVNVTVDHQWVVSAVANVPRPDLVPKVNYYSFCGTTLSCSTFLLNPLPRRPQTRSMASRLTYLLLRLIC